MAARRFGAMLTAETRAVKISKAKSFQDGGLKISWEEIIQPVTPFMDRVAKTLKEQVNVFDPEIVSFARYALANQGKQLRPALVALSGAATGKLNDDHVMVAVIIEMIHLATLVHDDVMDGARIRRNRPTVSSNWGTEISVLLGDCLFAHALRLAAGFPTTEVCQRVSQSTHRVCSGEIFQTLHRGSFDISLDQYFKVIRMKTAELFALSCDLGAAQSHADLHIRHALKEFGHQFGTAYQIYDDCLDIYGEEKTAGKSLGTDLETGKLTLPLLLARENATDEDREHLRHLVAQYEISHFTEVLALVEKSGALRETKREIKGYLEKCREILASVPESHGRHSLNRLVEFLSNLTETLGRN